MTFEMAILKLSRNLGFHWGVGREPSCKCQFRNSVNCKCTNIHLVGIKMTLVCWCIQEPIKSNTFLGFEYNWTENFQFYVEPSNLPIILLQKLEKGSKDILVYGGFGYGKTTLVKYVLYKNAKDLLITFPGGIFHMRYGHKDNEVLLCQKELIRALHLNPQEVSIQDCFACIPTFYYHKCGGRKVMNYLLRYVRHMSVCITNIYKSSSIIQTKLKKG